MRRIIIGITGATGVCMGARLVRELHEMPDTETHLIISKGARDVFRYEMESPDEPAELEAAADYVYDDSNLAAAVSSGSFRTDGMIVIPCSMKTLSGIAHAYDDNLITRAADVCLKEGRKVVLVPREMPLNLIHCRNLTAAAEAGCSIVPPVLTFYSDHRTIENQIDHILGKVLMQFGIDYDRAGRWEGV